MALFKENRTAGVFARVVDHNLGPLHMYWQEQEPIWVTTTPLAFSLALYADDIMVMATLCTQMARLAYSHGIIMAVERLADWSSANVVPFAS